MKKFSVVIPSDRSDYLYKLLKDFEEQEYSLDDVEILIIGGSDLDFIEDFKGAEFSVEHIEYRGGASSARNKGIEASDGEYLIFLDDDVRLKKNFLEKCEEYVDDFSAFCFRVEGPRSTFLEKLFLGKLVSSFGIILSGFEVEKDEVLEVSHFPGCCFVASREAIGSVRFDEYFEEGNGYLDDTDFTFSIGRKGYSLKFVPFYSVKHEMGEGGYRVDEYSGWLYYFWNHKSYFVEKHSGRAFLWLGFLFSFFEFLYISLMKRNLFSKELIEGWLDGWLGEHRY